MAKIYKVIHSDSLLNSSDNNDSRYVGIRSNATEKWPASLFNSSYIKVEEIDVLDALNEFHEKKYKFIFEVNTADYSGFLKATKHRKGILSYQDMDNLVNLSRFLKKLEEKGFSFESQDRLNSMRKLSTASAEIISSEKDTEIKGLISGSIKSEFSVQHCIGQQSTTVSLQNQSTERLATRDRGEFVSRKSFGEETKIDVIKEYLQQNNNELVTLDSALNKVFKKSEQLLKGFASYFFSDISREKQTVLRSILEKNEVIQDINYTLNTSAIPEEKYLKTIKSKLAEINSSIDEENLKILRKARGLTFFGLRKVTTTSDQIALKVKEATNALESKLDELASQVSVMNSL